jgi:putative spermidine/putrescine transport system ATP-binding protein
VTTIPGTSAAIVRATSSAIPAVRLEGVVKRFGNDQQGRRVASFLQAPADGAIVAVAGIDLEIADGEFFSMLGPSGSGKTTTLRMIAGFELPSEGRILLHGEDVTTQPPFERDVNTVFQDYALFPHMSVGENVAYGLAVRKVPREEQRTRVTEALRMVRLEGYETRRPGQLSGGQRQRVALARALVNRPRVLLLDEPLGALDLKLREEMQTELKAIQDAVGITFIYVTHDQQEALSMSDRIAVFNAGRIDQIGTPAELYERPATTFVAGFVGTSNLLTGEAAGQIVGQAGTFAIRPEKIEMHAADDSATAGAEAPDSMTATGRIADVLFLGSEIRYVVMLDAGPRFIVVRQNRGASERAAGSSPGDHVRLAWSRRYLLPLSAGNRSEEH